ncbi:hypothetical protein ACQ0N1_08805 [Lactiplantibacillus plantarum]|uniref:hypothetical protein n=1 Tax=Lactiplantibacillus plantarum TaxID=1590 RepID=UPI003D301819
MSKVVIKGELPSLNEYIKAERANRYAAAKLKKRYTALCSVYARASRNSGVQFSWPCKLKFTWYTKNNRKDADNIAFAKKFVLDGFMKAGLLGNDNRKHITGFQDEFAVDKRNPRVEIDEITEDENA